MKGISFTLNHESVCYEGNASDRLLDVLRDTYHTTSVKCGCKAGECGACAVLIDNALHNSCCVAMGAVLGREVLTLEGFRETPQFDALQKAYGELSAVQCGFCTPGMIMASHALLLQNPDPTEAEIREGLSGNLCRCTGYNAIVHAVQNAAKEGKGLW